MTIRTLIIAALILQLGGCVVTPRIEISERLDFDAPMPSQIPMSYDDVLCCYQCNA